VGVEIETMIIFALSILKFVGVVVILHILRVRLAVKILKTIFQVVADREVGIWTGGRSVLNYTRPAYVWMPEHYLMQNQFWRRGEPNIYADYTSIHF